MIGSASTSLSSMFDKRVDISPPESTLVDGASNIDRIKIDTDSSIVMVSFKLQVGDLLDSEIMQLLPIPFAKSMVVNLMDKNKLKPAGEAGETQEPPARAQEPPAGQPQAQQPLGSTANAVPDATVLPACSAGTGYGMQMPRGASTACCSCQREPAQFQSFEDESLFTTQ